MAFVTGLLLIDAPASALNNAGAEEGARTDNIVGVKKIRTRAGTYPYVSAQAIRYWIRSVLDRNGFGWKSAPVHRETKIAYTDGNPIRWWDDDLFGYMRAAKKDGKGSGKSEPMPEKLTPTSSELTRISPFRISTFTSIAPTSIVDDFGTMARHDGNPVPHEHQFYRATLMGLFSLDLTSAGTFFASGQTGYRNLDDHRIKEAKEQGLTEVDLFGQTAYRLPFEKRAERVSALIRAIGELEGGAKLALHYTDVTPPFVVAAVTKAGNNPFLRIIRGDAKGQPEIVIEALKEVLKVYKDQIVSDVYLGWCRGYLDEQRMVVEALSEEDRSGKKFEWGHPREIMQRLATVLISADRESWYS